MKSQLHDLINQSSAQSYKKKPAVKKNTEAKRKFKTPKDRTIHIQTEKDKAAGKQKTLTSMPIGQYI